MTREEAIRRMECCRDFLANNYSDMGEPNFTAFNMAIKALSQEPHICDSCKHKDAEWDTEPCDGCCGNHSGYEPQKSEDKE